jgi:hypothetical protein
MQALCRLAAYLHGPQEDCGFFCDSSAREAESVLSVVIHGTAFIRTITAKKTGKGRSRSAGSPAEGKRLNQRLEMELM